MKQACKQAHNYNYMSPYITEDLNKWLKGNSKTKNYISKQIWYGNPNCIILIDFFQFKRVER